jgi:hypothetical protein
MYASPQEAQNATPEEFLYLACLHEGTGVAAPDFIAVVTRRTAGSSTRRRCPTWAMSSTTSAGTAAARP